MLLPFSAIGSDVLAAAHLSRYLYPMEHIANQISALREARGLSERQLAEASAIPRMTLKRRLVNPASFTMDELGRVAAALGIDALALLAGTAA